MTAGIDNIQILATTAHRVGVLEATRDGPTARRALCEATGASSPTVGRVLADFESRVTSLRPGDDHHHRTFKPVSREPLT